MGIVVKDLPLFYWSNTLLTENDVKKESIDNIYTLLNEQTEDTVNMVVTARLNLKLNVNYSIEEWMYYINSDSKLKDKFLHENSQIRFTVDVILKDKGDSPICNFDYRYHPINTPIGTFFKISFVTLYNQINDDQGVEPPHLIKRQSLINGFDEDDNSNVVATPLPVNANEIYHLVKEPNKARYIKNKLESELSCFETLTKD